MTDVPIPFVNKDLDTDEGSVGVLMTIGVLIAGFAVFAWAQDVGGYVADRVNSTIASVVGVDPTSGDDAGVDAV